jgi:NADPH:quinone reductase-like Zn-dependent oxidoreductase
MRDVYNGNRQYPFPQPLVIGTSAVGRVTATGPDATALEPGQLVWLDMTIRGRDDPDTVMLGGIHQGFSAGSAKLMAGEWRDGTYAEYARMPL